MRADLLRVLIEANENHVERGGGTRKPDLGILRGGSSVSRLILDEMLDVNELIAKVRAWSHIGEIGEG